MALGLLGLLDDVLAVTDDIAMASQRALASSSGLLVDDVALASSSLQSMAADREIPVALSILKLSMINKLILVPLIFTLNLFWPFAIVLLLAAGGIYLAFEFGEKAVGRFFHAHEDEEHKGKVIEAAKSMTRQEFLQFEKKSIHSAARTDIILSLEITVICLSNLVGLTGWVQFFTLLALCILISCGIYGLVIMIIRMDDTGLKLMQSDSESTRQFGYRMVRAVPHLIKAIGFAGFIAMGLIGGELMTHNIGWLHHAVEPLYEYAPTLLVNFGIGASLGCLMAAAFNLASKVSNRLFRPGAAG